MRRAQASERLDQLEDALRGEMIDIAATCTIESS